jgi:hypothetical protein
LRYHWFPVVAEDVRVTGLPEQMDVGVPEIAGIAGVGFTVTSINVPVPVQFDAEAVIVYLTTAGLADVFVSVCPM